VLGESEVSSKFVVLYLGASRINAGDLISAFSRHRFSNVRQAPVISQWVLLFHEELKNGAESLYW
jgi:hypothetical protein